MRGKARPKRKHSKSSSISAGDLAGARVGYGKPPVATRFKRGVSGNPKGRPRGSRNLRLVIAEVFTDKIKIREGEKVRRVTRLEAVLRKQLEAALKGDQRGLQAAFKIAKEIGLLNGPDPGGKEELPYDLTLLNDEELQQYERILQKMLGMDGAGSHNDRN